MGIFASKTKRVERQVGRGSWLLINGGVPASLPWPAGSRGSAVAEAQARSSHLPTLMHGLFRAYLNLLS